MYAEELHGIFQFLEFEEKKEKKIEIDTSYKPIQPPILTQNTLESIQELLTQKDGPKTILSRMNYFYFSKEYSTCLEFCNVWIQHNQKLKKPLKDIEVLEIAIRSCIHLHLFQKALDYCKYIQQKEAGILFLKAKVCRLNGLKDAVLLYTEYLEIRNNDYLGWYELGLLFDSCCSLDQSDKYDAKVVDGYKKWASLCFHQSLKLIKDSFRPKTVFSEMHQQKEVQDIEKRIEELGTFVGIDDLVDTVDFVPLDLWERLKRLL